MKIHLLSGFLGSGKTTAIQKAAQLFLKQGIKTGVITNDQGTKLVDGDFFTSLDIPGKQVVNGCFCCNYNDLDASIKSLIETDKTEVIFAESVGSCTDIVATVVKPLLQSGRDAQVTVSVFADARLLQMILSGNNHSFNETVCYIYLKQLEEAGIIVINKIDLIDAAALTGIKKRMQEKYGDKILLYQNSLDENDLQQWLHTIDQYRSAAVLPSLNIDYDIYAAGEASLAWVDGVLEIFSPDNTAMQTAEDLVNKIYQRVTREHYPVGHLKFLLNNTIKISFTAGREKPASLQTSPAASAVLLVNMRVQADPAILTGLMKDVINQTETKTGCKIIMNSLSAFQPGYPRPSYRM